MAVSVGFDKPEYLIAPDLAQKINVQLKDSAGDKAYASETTYVYVTAGSPTAAISTKVSEPYSFVSPAVNIRVTVSTGDAQRGFMYRDATLGTTYLTATGSGKLSGISLNPGSLKITIGFPPTPTPAPDPAPVPVAESVPQTVIAVTPAPVVKPQSKIQVVEPIPQPTPEIVETKVSTEIVEEVVASIPEPRVLAAEDIEDEFNIIDLILLWWDQFISGKIWL